MWWRKSPRSSRMCCTVSLVLCCISVSCSSLVFTAVTSYNAIHYPSSSEMFITCSTKSCVLFLVFLSV